MIDLNQPANRTMDSMVGYQVNVQSQSLLVLMLLAMTQQAAIL